MKTSLIPNQNSMDTLRKFAIELPQINVHNVSVDIWRQQTYALPCLWTNRTDNIQPFIFGLPYRTRP